MKSIGTRRPRKPGFHWPEGPEAEFLNDPHRRPLYPMPEKRVMRFRNHEEAQADMERRIAEALPLYRDLRPAK